MRFTTMTGAGLTLGAFLPASAAAPMPFVRIGSDNTVALICEHVEAGRAAWTGLSAVLAEELDASWSQVSAEGAPAETPVCDNIAFVPKGRVQGAGGSTSMASSWQQLREAGATARAMLVSAAARRWSVPASEVTVSEGIVSHSSGARATFGELASDAAIQPVPKDVQFKDPTQYKLIGREKP